MRSKKELELIDFAISTLIVSMHSYNRAIESKPPHARKCVFIRGQIKYTMALLRRLGCPVSVCYRDMIFCSPLQRLCQGYMYIKFPNNFHEFLKYGVYEVHGFSSMGVYWFYNDNGKPSRCRDPYTSWFYLGKWVFL